MTLSLVLGSLWGLTAAIVALLPMRYQYVPGVALLATVLLVWLALTDGLWIFAFGVFAFLSMFQNPLIYFWSRARGEKPEIPT